MCSVRNRAESALGCQARHLAYARAIFWLEGKSEINRPALMQALSVFRRFVQSVINSVTSGEKAWQPQLTEPNTVLPLLPPTWFDVITSKHSRHTKKHRK